MKKIKWNLVFVQLVPIIMLGIALKKNPYGYYILLRWIVSAISLYLSWESYQNNLEGWAWIFGTQALIYNPLFRVHLGRDIWTIVNIVSIIIFFSSSISLIIMRNRKNR